MGEFDDFLERFISLRDDLFSAIEHSLKNDGHCKSYGGAFGIYWPDYFGGKYGITLDCYVIGPSRHYSWEGSSFREALDAAEREIRSWIRDEFYADYPDSKQS